MPSSKYRAQRFHSNIKESAIIVDYILEKYNDRSKEIVKSDKRTIIKVSNISHTSNADEAIDDIALSIIAKNKCFDKKHLPEIRGCIEQIYLNHISKPKADHSFALESKNPSINYIPFYLDLLYCEEVKGQTNGALMLLKLCRDDYKNTEEVVHHRQLMSAISRTYQSEKSLDLIFIVAQIFLAISIFPEYHSFLNELRVGITTLKILEGCIDVLDERRPENEFVVNQGIINVGLALLFSFSDNLKIQKKMVKAGLVGLLCRSLQFISNDNSLELVLRFLLMLSAFQINAHEMSRNNIISRLSKILNKKNSHAIIIMKLMLNISFIESVISEIMLENIPGMLIEMLKNSSLRAMSLKLIYNLSTNFLNVPCLVDMGISQIIVQLIKNFPKKKLAPELSALAVNLSFDQCFAQVLLDHNGINILLNRFIETSDVVLLKVIRNLSAYTSSFQFNHNDEQSDDEMAIRANYSSYHFWDKHSIPIVKLCLNPDNQNQDAVLELLGVLVNLTNQDFPERMSWYDVLTRYPLLSFIERLLVPGISENDLLLEGIILAGEICNSNETASIIAASHIIESLEQHWYRDPDNEIYLQILTTYFRFLLFSSTREKLFYHPKSIEYMFKCLEHESIRTIAERCLSLVAEFDIDLRASPGKVRDLVIEQKFFKHNASWIDYFSHSSNVDCKDNSYSEDDSSMNENTV